VVLWVSSACLESCLCSVGYEVVTWGRTGASWLACQLSCLRGACTSDLSACVEHCATRCRLGDIGLCCAVLCNAQVWIVLELCNGGTLKDAVSSGRLKVDSKMELVRGFLQALLTAVWGPLPLLNVPQRACCLCSAWQFRPGWLSLCCCNSIWCASEQQQ
jgi:hypothetical protein